MWLCRNRSSFPSLAMCCAAFSTQKHTPPITHTDIHQFAWTLSQPLEVGVALLKTMSHCYLYQVQLFPQMTSMFRTVAHWRENKSAFLIRKSGVSFNFKSDIF